MSESSSLDVVESSSLPQKVEEEHGGNQGSQQSSYYFFKSTPAELASQYAPKKVESEEVSKSESGASAWNKAGTWEEKDISDWAKRRLRELLKEFKLPACEKSPCKISKASKVEGHASVIYIRGKKKIGYEFQIEAEWIGETSDGDDISGKIELSDFCDYDEDYNVRAFS